MAAQITKAEHKRIQSKRYNTIIELRDDKKLSFKEIAAQLGISTARAGQLYAEGKNAANEPAHWTDDLPTRVGNAVTSFLGDNVSKEDTYMALISGALDRIPNLGVIGKKILCEYFNISVIEVYGETMPRADIKSYIPQKPELHNKIITEVTRELDRLLNAKAELVIHPELGMNDLAHCLGESVARVLANQIASIVNIKDRSPMQDIFRLEGTRPYFLFAFDQKVDKLRKQVEKNQYQQK